MAGKEYAIRNTYGYVNYLDEDGIECLREHGETVEILGDADDFRRMGYRSGDEAPPKDTGPRDMLNFAKRAGQAVVVTGGIAGAVIGGVTSPEQSGTTAQRQWGDSSLRAEGASRGAQASDATRDAGNSRRRRGKR